jgi:hypothetical protein
MTHGVTKDWVKEQALRAAMPVREGWDQGALTIFVPGRPRHFKGYGDRYAVARHTKDWRERTASRLFPWRVTRGPIGPWPWSPFDPKRIAFTVYCARLFDTDNLGLVCSGARDGLKDARLIQDDRESAGHQFSYAQHRAQRGKELTGIAITIEVKA